MESAPCGSANIGSLHLKTCFQIQKNGPAGLCHHDSNYFLSRPTVPNIFLPVSLHLPPPALLNFPLVCMANVVALTYPWRLLLTASDASGPRFGSFLLWSLNCVPLRGYLWFQSFMFTWIMPRSESPSHPWSPKARKAKRISFEDTLPRWDDGRVGEWWLILLLSPIVVRL